MRQVNVCSTRSSAVCASAILLLVLFVTAPASRAGSAPADASPVAVLTGLSTAIVHAGHAGFTLGVYGLYFVPGAVVQWDGVPVATKYFSPLKLDATIPTGDLTTAGIVQITVENPGTILSNVLLFAVDPPFGAMIGGISPTSVPAGHPQFTLTVYGAKFVKGSRVLLNHVLLDTTVVSSTEVTAIVPATDVALPGVVGITVGDPGTELSNVLPLTITIL